MMKTYRVLFPGLLLFVGLLFLLSACGDDGDLCEDLCAKAEYCASVNPDFVVYPDCRVRCAAQYASSPQSVTDCTQACVDQDCDTFFILCFGLRACLGSSVLAPEMPVNALKPLSRGLSPPRPPATTF